MTSQAITGAAAAEPADPARLRPPAAVRGRWPAIIGGLLTLAMVGGLVHQLWGKGTADLTRVVPTSPAFYLVFAALYMTPPGFDWLIFRRLWDLPLAGLAALVKKRIANDVLLGYSGEAYFYAWARVNAGGVEAPFAAVKDVSIQSALAGHAMTLALIALALPFGRALLTPDRYHAVVLAGVVAVAMSLPFLFFSRRVFSLPRGELWRVFGLQCARIGVGWALIAAAWHLALPTIGIAMWLLLVAVRQLVSRLPFIPNKDLLFVNIAIPLIGRDHAIVALMAFTAAATLLIHGVLIAAFSLWHVASVRRRR